MPLYLFENPQTGEVIEKFFHMDENKAHSENGVEYKRVWTKPNAAIDTQVNPWSQKDFVKATNKKGTLGDMDDLSAELSRKRAEKEGYDPVRKKYFKDYSNTRGGLKHPAEKREEANKKLEKYGVTIE